MNADSAQAAHPLCDWLRQSPPGLPKHAQLREALASAIRAGQWKPGERLPTEIELTRMTPFSLGTVQRALRSLVEDGLVVRAQGSGSFVAEGRGSIDEPLHLRFLGEAGEPRYLPLYPKVIARSRNAQPGPWTEWLGREGGDIVCIERKLSVNREFDVYNRFYFNAATFPEVATKPLSALDGANLKEMLGAAAGMPVTNVHQRVSALKFPPPALAALRLPRGTRGLLLETAASAGRSRPIYFLETYVPESPRRLDVS